MTERVTPYGKTLVVRVLIDGAGHEFIHLTREEAEDLANRVIHLQRNPDVKDSFVELPTPNKDQSRAWVDLRRVSFISFHYAAPAAGQGGGSVLTIPKVNATLTPRKL